MPNFRAVSNDTATARYAVAPRDSAVNILALLKDIAERAEDISDRLYTACSAAQGELADEVLEIEVAAYDLEVLVEFINKLTS